MKLEPTRSYGAQFSANGRTYNFANIPGNSEVEALTSILEDLVELQKQINNALNVGSNSKQSPYVPKKGEK